MQAAAIKYLLCTLILTYLLTNIIMVQNQKKTQKEVFHESFNYSPRLPVRLESA